MLDSLSIRNKLLLPGITGALLVVTVLTLFWSYRYSNVLHRDFDIQIQLMEEFVSPPLTDALWNFDDHLFQKTMESLDEFESYTFAIVYSGDDEYAKKSRSGDWDPAWDLLIEHALPDGAPMRVTTEDFDIVKVPLTREGEVLGFLFAGLSTAPIKSVIRNANTLAAIIGLIAVGVFAGLLLVITSSVARPIGEIILKISRLQSGDYDVDIPEAKRRDEIGALGLALEGFRSSLVTTEKLHEEGEQTSKAILDMVTALSNGLASLSNNDLTFRLENAFPSEYEELRGDFNDAMGKLEYAMARVISSTNIIEGSAEKLESSSANLSKRTENQAATLEEAAAALDELTASVKSTADGASEASSTAANARNEAEKSGAVVQRAVVAMSAIESSAAEISKITDVISDIAFQTNLLALNAGVEAARAGDAGSGFAVVASEVRALAQRSSEAAKDVAALIRASTEHVTEGSRHVGEAGDALTAIVAQVDHIASFMTNIADSTTQQAYSLTEINTGVNQLDQVTQQNSAMVEESTALGRNLVIEADKLAKVVQQFNIGTVPAAQQGSVKAA